MIYSHTNIKSSFVLKAGGAKNNFAISWIPANCFYSHNLKMPTSVKVKMLCFYPGKINSIAHCQSTHQKLFVSNKPSISLFAHI